MSFSSLEEMDESLVSDWNHVVTNGDNIYIVGNLIFRTQTDPDYILKRLKGKKHLIVGNHDKSWLNKVNAAISSLSNCQHNYFRFVSWYTM